MWPPKSSCAEGAGGLVAHRGGRLRPGVAGCRVTEGRQLEAVPAAGEHRQLGRVGDPRPITVDLTERLEREAVGRHEGGRGGEPACGCEVEDPVADERPADREADLTQRFTHRVDGAVGQLQRPPLALQGRRCQVGEGTTGDIVGAAAGDRGDQATGRLFELGLGAGAAHLELLDELGGDAVAEGPVLARVDPERTVPGVREVDAVNDVLVLEAAGAGDRGVGGAGAARGRGPRREVESVRELATNRDPRDQLVVHREADTGRSQIEDRGGCRDLDRVGESSGSERDRDLAPLAQPDIYPVELRRPEALVLDTDVVTRGCEVREEEVPAVVGRRGGDALVRDHADGRAGNRLAARSGHGPGQRSGRHVLRRSGDGSSSQDQESKHNGGRLLR